MYENVNIKITGIELNENDLFYAGYVQGNYFECIVTSDMALFDEITRKLNSQFNCLESIVTSLLYAEYLTR